MHTCAALLGTACVPGPCCIYPISLQINAEKCSTRAPAASPRNTFRATFCPWRIRFFGWPLNHLWIIPCVIVIWLALVGTSLFWSLTASYPTLWTSLWTMHHHLDDMWLWTVYHPLFNISPIIEINIFQTLSQCHPNINQYHPLHMQYHELSSWNLLINHYSRLLINHYMVVS